MDSCNSQIEELVLQSCASCICLLLLGTTSRLLLKMAKTGMWPEIKNHTFPHDGGGGEDTDISMDIVSMAKSLAINQKSNQHFENNNKHIFRQLQKRNRLLNKKESKPHVAPYVVSIQLMTSDNELMHFCAGTIIDQHWIMTAAHCLMSKETVRKSIIVAGCHDVYAATAEAEQQNVQLRTIEHYVIHELYLGGVNPYDIALIYTETPFEFNEFVQPASLPIFEEIPQGVGTLYGWGNVSMSYTPYYPNNLHEADLPILDNTLVENLLTPLGLTLHETNLCTGPLTGGVSICTADSGGPLIQMGTIIGIVSWGKMPCGQADAPSVFVRVSAFTNWIQNIMNSYNIKYNTAL